MKILDLVDDIRSGCKSVLTTMALEEYKKLSFFAFNNNGNIDGQRSVIKRSSTAAKIRKRMADDFRKGAIFPQVVLGVLFSTDDMQNLDESEFCMLLDTVNEDQISIIDGMQRSNIYFDNYEDNEQREIRVEFWCSDASIKLLYRMLVLNTGQVPWNTRRQLEVIFDGISNKISEEIKKTDPWLDLQLNILAVDEVKRRKAGMFKKSSLIEMYLGFNTRKVNVDVNDELADEFQRFDMMEAVDNVVNFEMFVDTFRNLCKLDFAMTNTSETVEGKQFASGQDLFRSDPVCLGFVVSCAEYIMGKMGVNRSDDEKRNRALELDNKIVQVIRCIENNPDTYLSLEVLNEIVEKLPRTRIGDNLRHLFKNAFSELIRYDNLEEVPSMETFWRE
ncbi:MAG: hypothetical protein Q4F24_15220 [Eubacteriales bacterium]|nr:hypothetical protein [Eubacteriales bacterium]